MFTDLGFVDFGVLSFELFSLLEGSHFILPVLFVCFDSRFVGFTSFIVTSDHYVLIFIEYSCVGF